MELSSSWRVRFWWIFIGNAWNISWISQWVYLDVTNMWTEWSYHVVLLGFKTIQCDNEIQPGERIILKLNACILELNTCILQYGDTTQVSVICLSGIEVRCKCPGFSIVNQPFWCTPLVEAPMLNYISLWFPWFFSQLKILNRLHWDCTNGQYLNRTGLLKGICQTCHSAEEFDSRKNVYLYSIYIYIHVYLSKVIPIWGLYPMRPSGWPLVNSRIF